MLYMPMPQSKWYVVNYRHRRDGSEHAMTLRAFLPGEAVTQANVDLGHHTAIIGNKVEPLYAVTAVRPAFQHEIAATIARLRERPAEQASALAEMGWAGIEYGKGGVPRPIIDVTPSAGQSTPIPDPDDTRH